MVSLLVVENHERAPLFRLEDWLVSAGAHLHIVAPHRGDALPPSFSGYDGVIVLGGLQDAFDSPDGTPSAPWFPHLKELIVEAVEKRTPYFGICLGAQLLVQACGGRVTRCAHGPELGAVDITATAVAANDPVFAAFATSPSRTAPAGSWHYDAATVLPAQSVLLASSEHTTNQAFRVGTRAWGVQFHPEWSADDMRWYAERDACFAA